MDEKIIIWSAADGTQQETSLNNVNTYFSPINAVDTVIGTNGKQFYLFDDNPVDIVEYDDNGNVKRFVIITNITTSDIKCLKKQLHKMDDLTDFDNYQEIIFKGHDL